MSSFHPAIDAWFTRRFGAPTAVQARAWPVIAAGRDALVMAPTGSGKTLAAFLSCLDRLVRSADSGALEDGTEILYVSPLKALSNDVQRNLDEPLAEIGDVAIAMGFARPGIRTAVRTGDTQASARRAAAKHPPHVLVTTPESLFILLTSESGRRGLCKVRTVIVDEIHALCADKRGAHLALSLARLDRLVEAEGLPRPQRVGLSATVRPIEVAMRMLVGAARPDPEVIDAGAGRELDLAIEVPKDELGAVATNEQWTELYDRIATLAREHRSTLVFVNTRRLVERVAFHLSERLGETRVAAHHGSLSRARRFEAERRLKAGELSVVVATASLELGIDVGAVDLACLVGSSRSIATAIQRIGRSGHAPVQAGSQASPRPATPKGRFFPLTRDQLIECAAIVRAARRGVLDEVAMRKAPLDILAQQIVATASAEAIGEDDLFALARQAAQYASLERRDFDAVVEMLSEGIAVRNGRAGALLHRDSVARVVRGRRGARIAALTSGGAIPDNANYDVVLEPDETKVGTIDEDFAIESMAGDVFLLGTTSWRIRRVEAGKVRVEDAKGAAPSIPFWLGEGPARTAELSHEVASLRIAIDEIVEKERANEASPGATADWLIRECALDLRGAELARDYVRAAKSALGALPTQDTIIAERFFDEAGGMQLVLHAPFGGRINRAFGMALRKSFCRQFDFELQAAATDDGVLLSLSPQHSFPLESIFGLVRADHIQEVLTQAALQAPMFGTRWRWNATRSLALLRFRNGKRVPPALLRIRSDDLLAAVFPAQTECQDNHGVGAMIELPDHPLVSETVRDCLTEAMDAEGLRLVLGRIARGEIRCVARETAEPSVLSHEILNANPYAFLDDAPLEERRSRAVNVRRGLPADLAERIGGLDQSAIDAVIVEAAPDPRNEDELHDLLLDLGFLPERDGSRRGFDALFDTLVGARRASRLVTAAGIVWVAAERRSLGVAVFPSARFEPELDAPLGTRGATAMERDTAIAEAVRAHLAIIGPTTDALLATALGLDASDIAIALAKIEGDGGVLRGRFSEGLGAGEVEWCDRRLLARIHRRTVDRLRREIEPATAAQLIRFLLAWQHAKPGARLHGRLGLERVVGELQGFELAAGAWECEVLPARIEGYEPSMLDALCLSGEITWGRLSPRDVATSTPTRAAPIALARRSDLSWLLAPRDGASEGALSENARGVLTHLRDAGASFQDEIVAPDLAAAAIEDALWELVSAGWVTSDGFGALRSLLGPKKRSAAFRYATSAPRRHLAAGRWALLRGAKSADDDTIEALARQYVKRYGVVFRDLLAREPRAPAWRDLVRVYRRLEMRGELRGGRLVGGFVGEQFASPEALEALRAIRREPETGQVVRLSACDPLNLVGVITPGPRVPAALGAYVAYRDGVPVEIEDEASVSVPRGAIVATPILVQRSAPHMLGGS